MTFTYCKQYGFSAKKINERLQLLELDSIASPYSGFLQRDVIVPNVDHIVDTFYDNYLLLYEPFRKIFGTAFRVNRLRHTLHDYLLTLGLDIVTPAYFEVRLRVGAAHARVGMPLSLYECAYRKLRQIVIDCIPERIEVNGITRDEVIEFVSKLISLDMSLATECYHQIEVHSLEESVEHLIDEEMALRKKMITDELTGLSTRGHVLNILGSAIKASQEKDTPLSIIMADLDHFKEINDTHGHLVGDQVLHDTARRVFSALRNFDIIGRYGGEEFIIVLSNTPREIAHEIAERIRKRVAASPIHSQDFEVTMTISQGIAEATRDDTRETLIARADEALYRAKEQGRNRVIVSD